LHYHPRENSRETYDQKRSFGGFEHELLTLLEDYAPPRGSLLAKEGRDAAGCAGETADERR
jgi:hypothetical protein